MSSVLHTALSSCRLFWGPLVLLLAVSAAHAGELETLASEAMTLSGTQAMLEGMGAMLEKQSLKDPRVAKLSNRERAQLLATLKSTYDGRRMADDLTVLLAATHDRERLTAAVAIMREPKFQKLTQVLVAQALNTTDQAVLAYAKRFEKTPPDPARVALILRLDAATDSARILADIRYESIEAMLGDTASAEDRAKFAAMREQIETNAKNEFVLRNLHLTRNLDLATLEAYVKAHENEPMGWLSRQLGYGIQRAIVKATGEMARRMAALAPPTLSQ
ncbi:MAG: hypothetical protein Q8K12_10650 [Thiobacillus sp.]|nr:hypothetical protein [Thiobacillus sp.]